MLNVPAVILSAAKDLCSLHGIRELRSSFVAFGSSG